MLFRTGRRSSRLGLLTSVLPFYRLSDLFLNVTHHASSSWSAEQKNAAEEIAYPLEDLPFPDVAPEMTSEEVGALAAVLCGEVLRRGARAALVQGEMTLTYALVRRLERAGVACYAAATARVASVEQEGGVSWKRSRFEFAGFRRYAEEESFG